MQKVLELESSSWKLKILGFFTLRGEKKALNCVDGCNRARGISNTELNNPQSISGILGEFN